MTYIPIIDSILAKSDLQTISEKRIRKGLQEAVGYDLTPQKVRSLVAPPRVSIWLHRCMTRLEMAFGFSC